MNKWDRVSVDSKGEEILSANIFSLNMNIWAPELLTITKTNGI